ncbi:hypothetical protein FHS21_002711 [Phyllobacterium trifolii]|jgi:hypothetical protein|uniref:Flagellar protein FlgN n=1 Tax=Phyllobacterium trifolii TaxID=300193 RepID=A0A839U5B8_9HYPH|nr:flagellar protein FlgN [Phyllobacterium trifolii]MBB3146296.1 hypothetical protein [Phyllobacterium trifolii]
MEIEIMTNDQNRSNVPEPALEPVLFAIRRLEDVVERETRLLLEGQLVDLANINANKSRGLRDFNKAMGKAVKTVDTRALKTLQPVLDSLRQKLDRNCDAIKLHLRAVTELAGIIRDALETQEADGTYTASQVRNGLGA